MTIDVLPALNGDSLIIQYDEGCILIDGGLQGNYSEIKKRLDTIKKIDLIVVTHIDGDHIGGIYEIFKDPLLEIGKIRNVWFNSKNILSIYFSLPSGTDETIFLFNQTDMGVKQANSLEKRLENLHLPLKIVNVNETDNKKNKFSLNGAVIILLSPYKESLKQLLTKKFEVEVDKRNTSGITDYHVPIKKFFKFFKENNKNVAFKQDTSVSNESSIAFILEKNKKIILMLGDSHPDKIIQSLNGLNLPDNKLVVDIMKVSHHGSSGNTNNDLLQMIDCKHFIISTNGGYSLPTKQCLARILYNNNIKGFETHFYFNYGNVLINNIFNSDGSRVGQEYNLKFHNLENTHYKIVV